MWTVNLIYLALAIVLTFGTPCRSAACAPVFRVKERVMQPFGVLDRYIGKTIFTTS